MFATELLLEQETETFGARKERKARQRSVTASSINTSIGSQSSTSSDSTEREQWWSASLKKAKSIKPKILRPSTSKTTASQKTINAVTQNLDSQLALHFKDPVLQPSWTYTSSLSSTLPSGDSLHSKDQLSELDGDISSRRTDSTRSRISRMQLMPTPRTTPAKVATAHSSTMELSRFQRFIRRMEGAGPKVILDRIKEDWNQVASEEADEELWLLTGFHMQNLGRPTIAPQSECNTGRILELYGNLLFSECHKLLAPGGFLEIRIMDAAPARQTAGPRMRMWIEDRLSINLERDFRCSKPCLLVPGWLADAGFEVVDQANDQNTTLPCAFDPTSATVDQELSTIIGRAFWKDIWGSFVDDVPGEPKWWWEDEEILDECVRRRTLLECKTIFAYKR
ncbi:conserved hypothetical protein [Pyrenophora tritici-repentis Pt-1C-BFP]|uniref:Uncharacterized protein n=1 Tax=Pyrenophora tritici-repentis (strain Pt-1C-BFP) TaxID=426418 RepID=B2VTZ9_PYRTR|nr:uncharacterized protein PTRG_00923 [Pyrenophora tritici-repentis Pt-1C-BFP]EDU40361.1 conserved hypothetical protein [Pyrenophora tritici-repentis Pt-1C-BFP]